MDLAKSSTLGNVNKNLGNSLLGNQDEWGTVYPRDP